MAQAFEVTREDVANKPFWFVFAMAAARLVSPLL